MGASEQSLKKQTEEKDKMRKERDDRCFPVVEYIYELIVEKKPTLSMQEKDEVYRQYEETVSDVLKFAKESGLTSDELKYVARLVSSRTDLLMTTLEKSIEINVMDMHDKVYGKPVGHLTLDEIDKRLKGVV